MKISLAITLLFGASTYGATFSNGNPTDLNRQTYHKGMARGFGPEILREYNTPTFQQKQKTFFASDPQDIALEFATSELGAGDFIVQSSYKSDLNGVTHVYLRQRVNGLEVLNGDININVGRHGDIISYGNSFAKTMVNQHSFVSKVQKGLNLISSSFSQMVFTPKASYSFNNAHASVMAPEEALLSLLAFVKPQLPDPTVLQDLTPASFTQMRSLKEEEYIEFTDVPFALSPVKSRQAYIQMDDGQLQLVWDMQLELEDNWYNAHVNAHDGTVVSLVDWVASASAYKVIPFGNNDPNDTERQFVENPNDDWASPEGWHTQGVASKPFNVTIGNNVYAHNNPDGGNDWKKNYRPTGTVDKDGNIVFDFEADFKTQEPKDYEDAAITNLFYWCNTAHDFFHRYGFDEKAGNFQQDNMGRGRTNDDGQGDAVIANAQDGSGRNNANFATPPDGQHGKMRMYIWDQTKPMRDGDFESGIVIHEYTHGVSIRLTGGPKNSNCLGWGEAGGMGEGWGDFVATSIRMKDSYTRDKEFGMGDYSNGGEGIRKYKYSTSNSTNPSTYRIMDRFDYWGVHAKGEVWAEMLYEVYWNLVDRLGYTSEWFPPLPVDTHATTMTSEDLDKIRTHIVSFGNTLAMQLVIDGLKLQPCSPSFVAARDAILEAEKQLTGGKYHCDIYKAFSKRGLGPGAKLERKGWIEQRVESYSLPSQCEE